ncbi:hypothetical protein ABW19_dt0201682 [Dactylella cylindrospora]|nr:hypothetical protein ABW19_dt0201682 [Dactylella cylindrospora]
MKPRQAPRRQSAFSVASTFFGPTPLGDDISLDREISSETQTSHVFSNEDAFKSSPKSSSQTNQLHNASPASSASVAPEQLQGSDLPDLGSFASPSLPSPPAPSLVPSAQLTPTISVSSGISGITSTTEGTCGPPLHNSRRSSIQSSGSLLPPFPQRKSSIASFMEKVKSLPKRLINKKDNSAQPNHLRSTCTITAAQISPPDPSKPRKKTKVERAILKNEKHAERYIQKKLKKRHKEYKREMKRKMSQDPETLEARRKMGKTEKLLKVMDDAKEKFWDWVDRRDEKRRRKQTRAYTAMREERRRSVLLAPVERDYEGLGGEGRRRGSRYGSMSTSGEGIGMGRQH